MYTLTSDNSIQIGNKNISFPKETVIPKIEIFKNTICFYTWPSEKNLDWSHKETHQIWKERCLNNPSTLFCYDFFGELKWKFPFNNVVGIHPIIPELKKEADFITPEHYRKYIGKYKGKELLEVYAGDFRYVLDANTGEIYDKMNSK